MIGLQCSHLGRKCEGNQVREDQIYVLLPETVSRVQRLGRRINQPQVNDIDPRPLEPSTDEAHIIFQARFESFELRPVGIQTDAEETDTKRSYCFNLHFCGEIGWHDLTNHLVLLQRLK